MFTKIFAGALLSVGLVFAGFLAGQGASQDGLAVASAAEDKQEDCCKKQLACCSKDKACCAASAKIGCCAKGMKCCDKDAACCATVQECCKAGGACCDEVKACCGKTSKKDVKDPSE